jgi:Ser/Thr protein kinase RdoA (MazF antagonist)
MKRFFDAVTSYEHPFADEMAARWSTGGAAVKVWRASANFVFRVYATSEQYFLRFNHENERNAQAIEAELKYIDHLMRHDIRVAVPVLSSSGNYVESISTEMGQFHAVLFHALTGSDWEFNTLDENQFELWGQALGTMHAASKGFSVDHRPSWKEHISFAEQLIPASEENACRELDSIKEILTDLSSSAEDFGLIHFDFELDNLKWNEDEAGVFDFDDCALYWFEADIAFALRALFEDSADKVDFECTRFGAFLKGYRSKMQISDAAVKRIPLFLRLHNLFSFARILRSLGDGPSRGEPKWTTDLRQRLTAIGLEYRNQFERCPLNRDWA